MAVLQTIRERYAKIAGFVIALSLVGFIAMDAGSGRIRDFFGADDAVAKVGGEKITQQEFQQRSSDYETLRTFFSKGAPVSAEQRAQNSEEALRSLIMDKQVEKEAAKLGLTVTDAELKSLYSPQSMDQTYQQFFTILGLQPGDPQIAQIVTALDKPTITDPQLAQIAPIWKTLKEFVRRNMLTQKYSAMITNGVITPKFVLDRQLADQSLMANVRFVKIPFASIPDAEVKVTDADINGYIERHQAMFRIYDPSRTIEYVSFDVMPDNDDTVRSLGELERIRNEFAATPEDKLENFVSGNSDERYTNAWVTKKTFMSPISDSVFAMSAGTLVGPYFDQGSYKLTRVVDKRVMPDSVTSRHILIKFAGENGQPIISDSIAKNRIDSIKLAIDGGADFTAMAAALSDDQGSKDSGGKYEFSLDQRSNLTKEFGDFIFDGKAGEKKIVKVESNGYSGYHYIEILSQKGSVVAEKIATLVKGLNPGEKANSRIYGLANSFAGANNDAAKFDAAVKKDNINKRIAERIAPNAYVIEGLGPARELIRWAYTSKVGAVSSAMEIGQNRYIVGKLTGEDQPGLMKITPANRPQLESIVREEMKAKKIQDKYKSQTSLDALATAAGQGVSTADSIRLGSSNLGSAGYAPKVVGYAFYDKFAPNTLSPALRAQDGVYYISVTSRSTAAGQDPNMAAQIQMMQDMQARNGIGQGLMGVIQRRTPVTYNADNIR